MANLYQIEDNKDQAGEVLKIAVDQIYQNKNQNLKHEFHDDCKILVYLNQNLNQDII